MGNRTKIKETVTSGEYGDYKLLHGYDGSEWRPIIIDSSGYLLTKAANTGAQSHICNIGE